MAKFLKSNSVKPDSEEGSSISSKPRVREKVSREILSVCSEEALSITFAEIKAPSLTMNCTVVTVPLAAREARSSSVRCRAERSSVALKPASHEFTMGAKASNSCA